MTVEEIAKLGKGVASDSREVRPGDIFVAIPSTKVDDHIQQAIDKGASAVVVANDGAYNSNPIKIIPTLNPRLMLAKLAKTFYPLQPKNTVAVTGTNGKSSVVHLIRQLWEGCGYEAASLGTLGLISKKAIDLQVPSLTTLGPILLHKTLHCLAGLDINHFAFEASSHGLDQYRLHEVDLKAAGFTNLTQDHLDYHHTMENYFLAKAKLFTEVLPQGATAVLNKDCAFFEQLQTLCQQRSQKIITYSLTQPADLTIQRITQHPSFLEFDLNLMGQIYHNQCANLVGRFQLENLLCALGLALSTGAAVEDLIKVLPSLQAVKGRMQWVGDYNNGSIFVDYAHTPDALETVLQNLRPHVKGQLRVVFGCGGNRDALKRPQMGAIACEYADQVIVTDDNPRYEDPTLIRQQILAACPNAKEIADRHQAIRSTIAQLKEGDIVLIAGKGHETGQIVGNVTYPFDDQVEVKTFLKEYANV